MRNDDAVLTPGPAVRVDFSSLHGFAAELRVLAQQVIDRCSFIHTGLDSDLDGELGRVENDWLSHRRQLQSFLSDTARSLDAIVAQYEKTNDSVARAGRPR
jgi:hypothetical protein